MSVVKQCQICGCGISSRGKDICYDCDDVKRPAALEHKSLLRCPKCGDTWHIHFEERGEVYEEGEHTAWCNNCDYQFEFYTEVNFIFTSPRLLEDEKK